MRHIDGESRQQGTLLPETLDDYVAGDHPVRVIDAYIDQLELSELGFSKAITRQTGRKPYHPGDLLKLYIYGYLNQVRSSRRLEMECHRNLEVIWLMKRLRPDFKTIADFRKDNSKAIRATCQAFIHFCRDAQLLSGELIAIDGSKFKAAASADRVITRKQLKARRQRIANLVDRYLEQLSQTDKEDTQLVMSHQHVERALQQLFKEGAVLDEAEAVMDETNAQQYCATEPEARLMRSGREGMVLGYNIQAAVDTGSGLIVHHEVTQDSNDQNQLQPMAEQSQKALKSEQLAVVADAGYSNGEHLANCEKRGITATVPSHRAINNKGDYFQKEAFRYDEQRNSYWCPAGEELPYKTRSRKDRLYLYTRQGCDNCQLKAQCTGSKNRWVSRHFYETAYARCEARLAEQPWLMAQRKIVERPFAILKQAMGLRRFQCRGKDVVKAETGLAVLSYNLKLMINRLGTRKLISALG